MQVLKSHFHINSTAIKGFVETILCNIYQPMSVVRDEPQSELPVLSPDQLRGEMFAHEPLHDTENRLILVPLTIEFRRVAPLHLLPIPAPRPPDWNFHVPR